MGKGLKKTNSADQEEELNRCRDVEEDCKWGSQTHIGASEGHGIQQKKAKREGEGLSPHTLLLFPPPVSNTKKSDQERSRWSQLFMPMHVVLVLILLLLTLLIVLTVVYFRSQLPVPDFYHVCPDSWLGFQGYCYFFSETESNWTTGQESCEALGASLAHISNTNELTFLKRYKGDANHWFGLRKEDDSWWWSNGTAFNNWFEVRGGGLCAYLNQERISSSLCHTKKNWLCSRPDNYVLWKQKAYP
ncbi:C-type lectin domain family 2 member A-like isoform X2 [Grus americana]|uniref:C-type lectin domain family 2 member A-like isoform X2 n=1 Tax=Grus americana TaxID=9117 RepID=UPI002407B72E|nr:C-type lectin domain family 2 member A-like isoform X2 [Grus americana]XP_054663580.1 C-type lectin domain family 2 member A-like isoform X2 [Grus americana]